MVKKYCRISQHESIAISLKLLLNNMHTKLFIIELFIVNKIVLSNISQIVTNKVNNNN